MTTHPAARLSIWLRGSLMAAARDALEAAARQRGWITDSEIPVPDGSSATELRAFYAAWRSELAA